MHDGLAPSAWVQRHAALLPPKSTVLDLACGHGRHLRWLAGLGHAVTGVDRDGAALATLHGLGELVQADLEASPWPLAGRRFHAVVVTNYLWRPLWPALMASLAPGGLWLHETFAAGQETLGRPSRREFLLAPGELLAVAREQGLRVLAFEDLLERASSGQALRYVQRIAAQASG